MFKNGLRIVGAMVAALLTFDVAAADKVQVFVGTDYPFAPAYVAAATGIFEKHGLDATVNRFNTGTDAVQAMRSAKAGYVLAGDLPSARTWAVGDVVGVAPVSWDDRSLAVLAVSNIKSAADLKGKRVATVIGSTGEIFFTNYLRINGIKRNEVDMINLSPGDMPVAMARGDIVAFLWNQPTTAVGLKAVNGSHFLTDGTKGFGITRVLLNATRATVENNPDQVIAVFKALREAAELIKSDPGKTYPIIAKVLGNDTDRVKEQIAGINYDMTLDKAFVEDMTSKIDISVSLGIAQAPIDWKKQWTTKFASAVDPKLVAVQP